MFYFKITAATEVTAIASSNKEVMAICNESSIGKQWARQPGSHVLGEGWANRNDFGSFEVAQSIAASATALFAKTSKRVFIATDSGPNVSPRFDVIEPPKLGDDVSYGFNGDYYPDGQVTFVGKNHATVRTSEGSTYYRKKLTGSWKKAGGTWSLVAGHVNERNPSF